MLTEKFEQKSVRTKKITVLGRDELERKSERALIGKVSGGKKCTLGLRPLRVELPSPVAYGYGNLVLFSPKVDLV